MSSPPSLIKDTSSEASAEQQPSAADKRIGAAGSGSSSNGRPRDICTTAKSLPLFSRSKGQAAAAAAAAAAVSVAVAVVAVSVSASAAAAAAAAAGFFWLEALVSVGLRVAAEETANEVYIHLISASADICLIQHSGAATTTQ